MAIVIRDGRGHIERDTPTPLAERIKALVPDSPPERAAFATPDLEKAVALPDIPADHKLRSLWDRRQKDAVSEVAQLWSTVLSMPTGRVGDEINQHIALWSGLFDIHAKALLGLVVPSAYGELLNERAEAFLTTFEQYPFDVVVSEMIVTRLADRLQRRHAHWMVIMHAADQEHRADASAKESSNASTPGPMFRGVAVSAKTKTWRQRRLGLYRKQQGITAADLGRRLCMDPSAIRAIVREDWDSHKVNETNRSTLLEALGITLDEWYATR